jgi:hypothetical protein
MSLHTTPHAVSGCDATMQNYKENNAFKNVGAIFQ